MLLLDTFYSYNGLCTLTVSEILHRSLMTSELLWKSNEHLFPQLCVYFRALVIALTTHHSVETFKQCRLLNMFMAEQVYMITTVSLH